MGSSLVSAALRARVQLDDALKLMDPDGAEALGSVWLLQTHESTVPEGSIKWALAMTDWGEGGGHRSK
jgi:hypothetical protein